MNNKRLGIVGGGQLARMLAQEIVKFDLPIDIYASDPNDDCPVAQYATKIINGDYKNPDTLKKVALTSDLMSYEIELASADYLLELEATGKCIYPAPSVLKIVQDKLAQSKFFALHDLPIPKFYQVDTEDDLFKAIESLGLPLMIKARFDSYDGKGNFLLRSESQVKDVFEQFKNQSLMAQQYVDFDYEVSVVCVGSISGDQVSFPVIHNIHGEDYHILHRSIAPAQLSDQLLEKARFVAKQIVSNFKTVGTFTTEFLVSGDNLYINEVAPRVHNSGHLTIEACDYSQFHLHLLAGIQAKLPQPIQKAPALMQNIIGPKDFSGSYEIKYKGKTIKDLEHLNHRLFFHIYGKRESKPFRKLGHWTLLGLPNQSIEALEDEADLIMSDISIIQTSNTV